MNKHRENTAEKERHFVNEAIRNSTVQVIDKAGQNLGEMSKSEALRLAEAASLDLVKVGEKGAVAIAKIMDFGKYLYEKKKQAAQAKKHQKVIQVKEVKMRPRIGIGDYETKLNRAISFLQEGKHVKFTLQFRGRQPISVREVGTQFFERIKNDIQARELGQLVEEKESKSGMFWSKVFYIKGK